MLTQQHIFKEKLLFLLCFFSEFFSGGFFHGNINSTEKVFFFATTVKLNSQNNCVKIFPIRRYKGKQLSLLATSWKDSIFGSHTFSFLLHIACRKRKFFSKYGHLPFPLQLITSQKRQQQQYITNTTAYQFLSILKLLYLQEMLTKQHIFKEKLLFLFGFFSEFFFGVFFHGNRNSTEKVFFSATTVKLNSQNNCVKMFPIRRYKRKQLSLLATSRNYSIFGSQKNPIKCKALFRQWNLEICKLYGVSSTEEQFDFPRQLIPVAHCLFRKPTVCTF